MKKIALDIIERVEKKGIKHNENDKKKAQYWHNIDGETLSIYFQGSIHLFDWICNFTLAPSKVPYKNMEKKFKIHKGYLKQYLTVRDEILELAKNDNIKKIIISGHSLGAALATICLEDMVFHYKEKEPIAVAVAPPKCLKKIPKEIKERFEGLINVINTKDLITKVPPFYKRLGHIVKVTFKGNLYTAHEMCYYIEALKKEIKK